MNPLLGRTLELRFDGVINCVYCGRRTNKSFNQGFCYPCFEARPEADVCIVKPHVLYASLTSGARPWTPRRLGRSGRVAGAEDVIGAVRVGANLGGSNPDHDETLAGLAVHEGVAAVIGDVSHRPRVCEPELRDGLGKLDALEEIEGRARAVIKGRHHTLAGGYGDSVQKPFGLHDIADFEVAVPGRAADGHGVPNCGLAQLPP